MSGPTSFWARRRAGVRAEAMEADVAATRPAVAKAREVEPTDEEILAELDLPDPDTLQPGDDFTAFMAKAVPHHLRNRALRKLWRSNPVLACVDGLNDYDDDYLTGSYGNAPIKTGYQVGKGMMSHLLEMQRQAEAAEDPAEVPQPEEVDTTDDVPELIAQDAAEDPHVVAQDDGAEAEVTYTPRRMQFTFDEERA